MAPTPECPVASLRDLVDDPRDISIATFNLLLPNHAGGGWWVPRSYPPGVAPSARAWPHRHALIRGVLTALEAHVLCLQEVVEATFADDLGFLFDLGYDAVLHRKYRLRVATFWRREAFSLRAERHSDRTLTLALDHRPSGRVLHVGNVHLTGGGAHPDKRLRQTHTVLEDVGRNGGASGSAVVVCGDFNSEVGAAPDQLLTRGSFGPDDRDPRAPESALTSRQRTHPFGPFREAMVEALGTAPDTLVVPRWGSVFVEDGRPTTAFFDAVEAVFARFSADERMDAAAVDRWITAVNGQAERGSEHRKAVALLAGQPLGLTLEDLARLYWSELAEARAGALAHAAELCGHRVGDGPPQVHAAGLDHVYYTPESLALVGVAEPLSRTHRDRIARSGGLPNDWFPSDHVPLGVVLRPR